MRADDMRCLGGWSALTASATSTVVLSILDQSAARMLAWPWCVLYVISGLLPWCGLLIAPPRSRLSWSWYWVPSAAVLMLVVSTALSPLRQQLWFWLTMPVGGLGLYLLFARLACGLSVQQERWLVRILAGVAVGVALDSLGMWIADVGSLPSTAEGGEPVSLSIADFVRRMAGTRNTQPLGHANYIAGSSLLLLPWVVAAWMHSRRWERVAWSVGAALVLGMLASSGSRGGLVGAGVLACVGVAIWNWKPGTRWRVCAALAGLCLVMLIGVALHPAWRSALRPRSSDDQPNLSNLERWGMLAVGFRAARERPLYGWGVGAVPLVYDRFRTPAEFGPINMLQVHNTPLNLAVEGGILFLASVGGVVALLLRGMIHVLRHAESRRDPVFGAASMGLAGYAVFAWTDYQLDLPIIVLLLTVSAAVVAIRSSREVATTRLSGWASTGPVLAILACAAYVSIPWVRARALLSAGEVDAALRLQPSDGSIRMMRAHLMAERSRLSDATSGDRRVALRHGAAAELVQALECGGNYEAIHFSLGWILLDDEPGVSREAFNVVCGIAPAREGAWLGTALAALRQHETDVVVPALVRECLVDPAFFGSGWWRESELSPYRAATLTELAAELDRLASNQTRLEWARTEAQDFRLLVLYAAGQLDFADFVDGIQGRDRRRAVESLKSFAAMNQPFEQTLSSRLTSFLDRQFGIVAMPGLALALAQACRHLEHGDVVRSILTPELLDSRNFLTVHPRMAGFGVRQRNPYAQGIRSPMPVRHNLLLECFLADFLPRRGWLRDAEVTH